MRSRLDKKIINSHKFRSLVKKKSFVSWFLSSFTLCLATSNEEYNFINTNNENEAKHDKVDEL